MPLLHKAWDLVTAPLTQLTSADYRLCWIYLLASVVAALGLYLLGPGLRAFSPRRFATWLLPRDVYWHPSARLDYLLIFLNQLAGGLLLAGFVVSETAVAAGVYQGLTQLFGPEPLLGAPGTWATVMYTLAMVLAFDFSRFVVHALQHKVPLLWEFHKVHHSARVLTPVTLYRVHPLAVLPLNAGAAAATGWVTGVFVFLYQSKLTVLTVLGVNGVLFAMYLLANLRHSHIPLGFGPVLSRLLMSPHQHQVHHSDDPKHFDKNFGASFAFWDWLFGTLYVPEADERFTFGLGEENPRYESLWGIYAQPFKGAFALLTRGPAAALLPPRPDSAALSGVPEADQR